jgi:hypothetical protein
MRFRWLMPSRNATEAQEEVGNSKHSRYETFENIKPKPGITCDLALHPGETSNERAFSFKHLS